MRKNLEVNEERSHGPAYCFRADDRTQPLTGRCSRTLTRAYSSDRKLSRLVPVNVAHLKKVLIAIDFSEESKKALCYGTAFARLFGASLIALHIVEEISCQADYGYGPVTRHIPNQSALRRSRTRLIRLGKKLVGSDVKLTAMTDSGSAHAEIVKVAKKLDVDLIIMGTRGICANEHTSLGSTAQKVVRDAPCPVLVVRRKQHEFVSGPKV